MIWQLGALSVVCVLLAALVVNGRARAVAPGGSAPELDIWMTYHLHTERCKGLDGLVSEFFQDFTIVPARGYWHGSAEQAVIIEVAARGLDGYDRVTHLAESIKVRNSQAAVLIEAYAVKGELV